VAEGSTSTWALRGAAGHQACTPTKAWRPTPRPRPGLPGLVPVSTAAGTGRFPPVSWLSQPCLGRVEARLWPFRLAKGLLGLIGCDSSLGTALARSLPLASALAWLAGGSGRSWVNKPGSQPAGPPRQGQSCALAAASPCSQTPVERKAPPEAAWHQHDAFGRAIQTSFLSRLGCQLCWAGVGQASGAASRRGACQASSHQALNPRSSPLERRGSPGDQHTRPLKPSDEG